MYKPTVLTLIRKSLLDTLTATMKIGKLSLSLSIYFLHSIFLRTVSSHHMLFALLCYLGRATCNVHLISAQTSQEAIQCTKKKSLTVLIYILYLFLYLFSPFKTSSSEVQSCVVPLTFLHSHCWNWMKIASFFLYRAIAQHRTKSILKLHADF